MSASVTFACLFDMVGIATAPVMAKATAAVDEKRMVGDEEVERLELE
jgi:hypothetical protein